MKDLLSYQRKSSMQIGEIYFFSRGSCLHEPLDEEIAGE